MTSRRRQRSHDAAGRAAQTSGFRSGNRRAQRFVALDVCCEGVTGYRHPSHRIWRFTVYTYPGSPGPEGWTDKNVRCLPDRDGALPEPFGTGDHTEAERWRDAQGVLWVPCDCLVCGRQVTLPLGWIRGQLEQAWAPNAQCVLRFVV